MHICPQEIIAMLQACQALTPYTGLVKLWCEQCVSGEHKTCEDHAADQIAPHEHHAS